LSKYINSISIFFETNLRPTKLATISEKKIMVMDQKNFISHSAGESRLEYALRIGIRQHQDSGNQTKPFKN
jgi:hypothetical protein